MKKFVITAFIVLSTITSYAQVSPENSEHLLFKGVPIDGTLNEYVLKMEENGFTNIGTEDGTVILKGDFASFKNCIIGVATQKQNDLVSQITVEFPKSDTWSSLYSNYTTLKELLSEKYGKPTEIVEKFQLGSLDNDQIKFSQVRNDGCKYFTTFETDKGKIQLSIDHKGFSSCFVMLSYMDKLNGKSIREKAIEDL